MSGRVRLHMLEKCRLAKQTQKTEAFSSLELRAMEQRLERVAARLAAIRDSMLEADAEKLYLFNAPSARLGLQNAERFANAAELSIDATLRGQPYGPNTSKTELGDG